MKLNKITRQWLVYHALHSDAAGHTELEIIEEIDKALKEDTLEIEGYIREDLFREATKKVDEWTRFDPNDPKTFPTKNEYIYITNIYTNHDERWACKLDEYYLELVVKKLSSAVKDHGAVIYWRPLPKPPVETEGVE